MNESLAQSSLHRQRQTLSPGGASVDGMSGISSAKTTAKPLKQIQSFSAFVVDDSENSRSKMPINMAVEEPWSRVISHKANRNLISRSADADYVTHYRVVPVIGTVPCAANDPKGMAMKMDRMLTRRHT